MRKIKILDKEFKISIPAADIKRAIEQVAMQINGDFDQEEVLFLSILNGSFMFSADLMKKIRINCRISFVKFASYAGVSSTGTVNELIGVNESVEGKNIIILEDIVETGTTLEKIVLQLKKQGAKKVKVASLLFKPQSYQKNLKVDYVGFEIANDFVVGYGLDYNGYGRNYENIYTLIQ